MAKKKQQVALKAPIRKCCDNWPDVKNEGYVETPNGRSWEYHCYNCGKTWTELEEPPCKPDVAAMADLVEKGDLRAADTVFQKLCKKHKLKDYEAVMLRTKVTQELARRSGERS